MVRPKNIFLLDPFYNGNGNTLLLYERKEERNSLFTQFIMDGIDKGDSCIYVHPPHSMVEFDFYPESDRDKHIHEISLPKNGSKLADIIDEIYSSIKDNCSNIRIGIDFGNLIRKNNIESIMNLEKELHELGVPTLSASDITEMDQETANKLMSLHNRTIISSKESKSISWYNKDIGDINVVSYESMEQSVKGSLEIIILSLLNQKPIYGFDIIKTIVQNFGVLLSQGTVYPLLYSLKEQGYVEVVTKNDNKTRVYVPTESGKEYFEEKIIDYLGAQKEILETVRRLNK